MPERPIILFPTPEQADKEKKKGIPPKNISFPSKERQYDRLNPKLEELQRAFDNKNVVLQQSSLGINPDYALVFEVVGSAENFYTAVRKMDGLEWIFDSEPIDIESDDDFYHLGKDNKSKIDGDISGKIYCIMSNKTALSQLVNLWKRYKKGEENVFENGFYGLRDIFRKIKDIRLWDAKDRIVETHIIEYWKESLEISGKESVSFEIELFFRNNSNARKNSANNVKHEISVLGGKVLRECTIDDIFYHGLLVELPRNAIIDLVDNYEDIKLARVDDIMYFRPTCQSAFYSSNDTENYKNDNKYELPQGDPIVAVLDGAPIQNHSLLKNRIIVDDPDNYEHNYDYKYRIHGTSMASLAIYGDLNKNDNPISTPIYVRPILKPNPNAQNVE